MSMQWITEEPQTVGLGAVGLDANKNLHAKTVLAMWNRNNNFIFPEYPRPDDLLNSGWGWRDAKMLGNFVEWWNIAANPPLKNWGQSPLPQPSYTGGFQQSDLTDQHVTALDAWATKSNAGLPSCIENCLANLTGSIGPGATQAQLAQCIDQCAGGAQTPKCPSNLVWDEAGQTCKCPSGWLWDGTKCMQLPPPPTPTCPPGQVYDGKQCVSLVLPPSTVICPPGQVYDPVKNVCEPILPPGTVRPPAPPDLPPGTVRPAPPTTAATTKNNAATVLAVLAGVGLVGLIINLAIKAPAAPMSSNPPRKPAPKAGYAFEFQPQEFGPASKLTWKSVENDSWETVLIIPDLEPSYRWVGRRHIDGSEVNVWKTGDRYVAQTTASTGR